MSSFLLVSQSMFVHSIHKLYCSINMSQANHVRAAKYLLVGRYGSLQLVSKGQFAVDPSERCCGSGPIFIGTGLEKQDPDPSWICLFIFQQTNYIFIAFSYFIQTFNDGKSKKKDNNSAETVIQTILYVYNEKKWNCRGLFVHDGSGYYSK